MTVRKNSVEPNCGALIAIQVAIIMSCYQMTTYSIIKAKAKTRENTIWQLVERLQK
jgi:hypothetical protein